jgi:hypothetical protein
MKPIRAILCLLFLAHSAFAQAPRPNILFIAIDDQGYADVGFGRVK